MEHLNTLKRNIGIEERETGIKESFQEVDPYIRFSPTSLWVEPFQRNSIGFHQSFVPEDYIAKKKLYRFIIL